MWSNALRAGLCVVRGHGFVDRRLSPQAVVVDLGANRGDFSRELFRRHRVRTVAVEASRQLYERLPRLEGGSLHHCIMADVDGELDLHLSTNDEASSVLPVRVGAPRGSERVRSVTLPRLLESEGLRAVDLLKVDIEGAETRMLGACPDELLRAIDQITIEFHDFCGQIAADDVRAVVRRLRGLGFDAIRLTRNNENWLFLQRRRLGVGRARLLYWRHVVRNAMGLARIAERRLRRRD